MPKPKSQDGGKPIGAGGVPVGTDRKVAVHRRLGETKDSVRYGAGRGGFSLGRPRPYTGPGGVCFG